MESAISFESANLHLRFLYAVSFESCARRARQWGAAQLWVSAQPEHLLQRAVPIVQAAVAREQSVLLFPALHQWVTPAEAHVYETAAKLLTELFLEN